MKHRARRFACLLALIGAMAFTGCAGTGFTRDSRKHAVGKYPFQAFVFDINSAGHVFENDWGAIIGTFAIVSIPMDAVIDSVLLPADLILWPCGFRKSDRFSSKDIQF